jgi:hypothetical protein
MHSDALRRNQTHAQMQSDAIRRTCRLVPKIRSSRQSSKSLIAHLMREAISMHSEKPSARTRTQSAYTRTHSACNRRQSSRQLCARALMEAPSSDEGDNQHAISYARTDGSAFI